MNYSIIKTDTIDMVFGENDPRNYRAVHHQLLAGGSSLEEAQAEAMRAALHLVEELLSDHPAAVTLVWRTDVQLDLQLAWSRTGTLTTRKTYVICPSRQALGEEVRK
jgi:hypothetical protein